MRDEFQQRLRRAARGAKHGTPDKVDTALRALVKQLQGGGPAGSTGAYRVVGGRPERPRPTR